MDKVTPKRHQSKVDNSDTHEDDLCNCNDEYRNTLCPIHDIVPEQNNNNVGGYQNSMLLTDQHIISPHAISFSGHCFICLNCQQPIMHNMHYCPSCGVRVIVQSKIVTNYINDLAKQQGQLR